MLSIFLIIIGHASYGVTNTLWKNPRDILGTLPLIIYRSGTWLLFSDRLKLEY